MSMSRHERFCLGIRTRRLTFATWTGRYSRSGVLRGRPKQMGGLSREF